MAVSLMLGSSADKDGLKLFQAVLIAFNGLRLAGSSKYRVWRCSREYSV